MNRKGFTLIELLIVVAIISILAGIVLVGLRPSLNTSRDARRAAELRQLQTALQLYYNRFGAYPSALLDLTAVGIKTIPKDPDGTDYGYTQTEDHGYVLAAQLEEGRSNSLESSHYSEGGTVAPLEVACDDQDAKVYCLTF